MNWENGILNPLEIFRIFDLRKGPANILTPLFPNVNNANINSNR